MAKIFLPFLQQRPFILHTSVIHPDNTQAWINIPQTVRSSFWKILIDWIDDVLWYWDWISPKCFCYWNFSQTFDEHCSTLSNFAKRLVKNVDIVKTEQFNRPCKDHSRWHGDLNGFYRLFRWNKKMKKKVIQVSNINNSSVADIMAEAVQRRYMSLWINDSDNIFMMTTVKILISTPHSLKIHLHLPSTSPFLWAAPLIFLACIEPIFKRWLWRTV